MSTQINSNVLANFIVRHIGADKLAKDKADSFDIDNDKFEEANKDDNDYLDIDEILDNEDLYEQFATLYQEQNENEDNLIAENEDDKNKVQSAGGAGVA